MTFLCYPENTTRVVLLIPLVVTFYVAETIFNHGVIVVQIHTFWYNSHPDEKYHFGGTGCGIYRLRIPLVLRIFIVATVRRK
jgi:uncharacterized membrane protein